MKVAIITGATSGIGREAALQIDKRFDSLDEIWIIGRREEKLQELEKHIRHSVRMFVMDVTNEKDMNEFEDALFKLNPNVRMLFQSAGQGLHGKFTELPAKDQTDMIRLNCEAVTNFMSMCIPFMKRGSHIINVASSAGFIPLPGYSVYSASKAYVLQLSRAVRAEVKKKGIYVMAVCPGPVNTEFFDISERYGNGISSFKRAMMNTPEVVVRRALGDAALHKPVSVDGEHIGLLRLLVKFLPKTPLIDLFHRFF